MSVSRESRPDKVQAENPLHLTSDLPHYAYQSLGPQSIRILELHPGPPDAPLICNIVIQRLDDAPYEAVSYVWGSPAPAAFIIVAGSSQSMLPVGANLNKALRGLRLPHERRRLWADAICINQSSLAERKSQVRMMGHIYSHARRSCCWIGYSDDQNREASRVTARLAMRFVRDFNGDPQRYLQATRRLFHAHSHVADADEELRSSWQAIKELFDLEYIHRVWIIQEVGLARHAQILWASEDICVDWTELAIFAAYLDFNAASVINHLELKSWVANHINFVWSRDDAGKPKYSFVEVLHWARIHRATDPRDHVYALLSHENARVDGELLIEPDYTISTTDVYIGIATSLVERTHSLHLLDFVDHFIGPSVLDLPTWVADWHAINIVAPLRFPTKAASEICKDTVIVRAPEGIFLECRGHLVDRLATLSEMIDPSGLTVTNLQHELQKAIPFLVDHVWEQVVTQPGLPHMSWKTFITSLSLICSGGYRDDIDSTSGTQQESQQADCAALILEYERIRADSHPSKFFASLSHSDRSLVQTMAIRGSAEKFVQDMTWNTMCRRIFRTAKGHLGLGPHTMSREDCCAVLPGSRYPVLLRQVDNGFELVGPTLLDGFMDGEAGELWRRGELREEIFRIF